MLTRIFVIIMVVMFPVQSLASSAFNVLPLRCVMQGVGMDLNGVPWDKRYLPNGLEDYMFDVNNDGRADMELLVPIDGDNRLPTFYWVNDEFAVTKYTIQDTLRDGTCKGMVILETTPKVDFRKGA